MNSLSVNLEKGQKVVMHGDGDEASRTVTVHGGFGMVSFTTGTALMVKNAVGERFRMDAMEIEQVVSDSPPASG